MTRFLEVFESMFPQAECELIHGNVFELLISVMLSAQTTDKSVNKLTENLFQKYKTPSDYLSVSQAELENDLRSIGLYKNKAKNIQLTSKIIKEEHNNEVPNTREDLVKLPGVGRKTANVVLSVGFGVPAIPVDTHVDRVSKRLGLAKDKDSVLEVEKKLQKIIPEHLWNKSHHQFIFFGRYHCTAKNPKCHECLLTEECKYYKG